MTDTRNDLSTTMPAGWLRPQPDSSGLEQPRVMKTMFVSPTDHDQTVADFEVVLDLKHDQHLPIESLGLTVTTVGGFIVISGEKETLDGVRHVEAVVLVAYLDEMSSRLEAAGAEIVQGPTDVPVGRLLHARHRNGSVVEYVEHRRQPGE